MAWRTDFEGFRPMGTAYAHGSGQTSTVKSFWGYSRIRYEFQGPITYDGYTVPSWSSENRSNGGGSPQLIQLRVNAWLAYYRRIGRTDVPAALVTDGNLGAKSDYAIQYLQRRFGIGVDGIVGSTTWGRIVTAAPGEPV